MSKWYRRIRRDDLANCKPKLAGKAAMQVIDALQEHPPYAQLLGLAVAFAAMLKRTDVSPSEVHQYAERLLYLRASHTPELGAIRDYIEAEVLEGL